VDTLVALSAINVVVYYDPKFDASLLGPGGFALFFYWYIWLLLFQFVLSLVGLSIMVSTILQGAIEHKMNTKRSNQSPPANRWPRDDRLEFMKQIIDVTEARFRQR